MRDFLAEEQKRHEQIDRFTRMKDDNFRALSRNGYDKGRPFEANYSIAYDKLALLGIKQRLKAKYRSL